MRWEFMAVRGNTVLDTRGHRPESVTVSAVMAAIIGGGDLFGLVYLAIPMFDPTGSDLTTVIVTALAVVQAITCVLLFVGARRFSTGEGRGMLLVGGALEFLLCAVYGWYAVAEIAGDPQDGGVFFVFFGVPCGVAVMTAGCLFLALLPSATAYVSRGGTPAPPRVETITR
jgi:hypothetical protein